MRWFLLLGLLVLGACSHLPIAKKMTPQESTHGEKQLVQAAIDQYRLSGETELLQQLAEQEVDSYWGRYADALLRLSAELELLKDRSAKGEVDCGQLVAEQEALQQENELLNQKIEQLKKLLIELEQRPR
ncbi:hypothetical protein SAMN02745165_00395 [Malonomonas rubra DSM 5091]|uniref:DUF4398 domain-containing protein n=1 Tax=Malonomonas rubra DSM 5091 TaxID=1122189 RepID=A0A1M6C492_MALRU|nr:hypothetical protein [Malonomonas rubra]SHI55611.1 hypothetical protein SAMN02745165_00395 [Malonomonas rubra DSM 5091]